MRARRLAARWLIPVEGAPIEHGALLIGPEGRFQAIGPDSTVPRPSDALVEDFGDAVILPGLINTHTHLELTGFAGQVQEPDFPGWIRRLRELKTTRGPGDYLEAARRGLTACYAGGVTTIADTGDSGAALQVLAESSGSGVAYQEVFGPHPDQSEQSLGGLRQRVEGMRRWAENRVRIGVSPHAPYTVSGPLFRAVAAWSRSENLPLAVHIAESPAETELLASGSGPFADGWRARGIPMPRPSGLSPVEWLAEHDALSERTLCIHAVQVDGAGISRLADSGAAVAHCPVSNEVHGHGTAPIGDMLRAGIRVGIGTDSEVSVGRLDMRAEARAARAPAGLTAEAVLELCTLGGARALGLASETGSLRVGKWADCVVIGVSRKEQRRSPGELVLASSATDLRLTCLGGRDVYRAL